MLFHQPPLFSIQYWALNRSGNHEETMNAKKRKCGGYVPKLLEITKAKAVITRTQSLWKKLALVAQMYTKIKTYIYRIWDRNDNLLRKLTEFKASNQDKLHPTTIKTILSTGAWNHCRGSPAGKGTGSRKPLAVWLTQELDCPGQHFLRPLGMDSEAGSGRMRRQQTTTCRSP